MRLKNSSPIKKRGGKIVRLFKKQSGKCYYCGIEMRFFRDCSNNLIPKNYCTKDHVLPRSKGGGHSMDNLVAACFECNVKKGDK